MSIVAQLQKTILSTISDLIPSDGKFALLDFPDHDNIGDSAIYVGESDLFKRLSVRPAFISAKNHTDWTSMEAAIGDGPIFIHGGGNFGDLWPDFNDFHEEILRRYPGRRVVQLPQTIFYEEPENAARMAALCEAHTDFVLLVRDLRSFEFAKENFKADIRLCPDSAFMIEKRDRLAPTHELLMLLRQDKEARGVDISKHRYPEDRVLIVDWPEEVSNNSKLNKIKSYLAANAHEPRLLLPGNKHHRRGNLLEMVARSRLRTGTELLSKGRTVITDRLHGHILCTLLNIPHVVIDNSYGKISGFASAWGTFSENRYFAQSVEEAIAILTEKENLVI
ncbi:polysaccharide pyruvyl transferase family protein [Rhizobium binxianense]|uniref:polysaccharide pyruvyl transferase family protein n=1 Tax=Rhizobium binxianense TaxID=3024242 RepID=UPI00235F069A|nr:polysaccharide pyruvyl transferase family protein [Rhizobium sp. MJ37]MDC9837292.1 polysaccharide pyruvyl transferase family protein [Rhizobium sp. MJ37]